MLGLVFAIVSVLVFSRLVVLAVKAAWGLAKVFGFLVLLPIVLIVLAVKGLVLAALIGLLFVGLGSLAAA